MAIIEKGQPLTLAVIGCGQRGNVRFLSLSGNRKLIARPELLCIRITSTRQM